MLNASKIRNRLAIGLTALALGASLFPAPAAAYSPPSVNPVPGITVSPTTSSAVNISVSYTSAPVGPIITNVATVAQINVVGLNISGSVNQAAFAQVCQQTANSCGGR